MGTGVNNGGGVNDTFDLGIGVFDISIVIITGNSGVGDGVDTVDIGIGIFDLLVIVTGVVDDVFGIVGNDIVGIIGELFGLCGLCESSCSKRSCKLGPELVRELGGIGGLGNICDLRDLCGP